MGVIAIGTGAPRNFMRSGRICSANVVIVRERLLLFTPTMSHSAFNVMCALRGSPPMRYHDLRHGAASLTAAQGVPARVAMEVLGHAQISTARNI